MDGENDHSKYIIKHVTNIIENIIAEDKETAKEQAREYLDDMKSRGELLSYRILNAVESDNNSYDVRYSGVKKEEMAPFFHEEPSYY